MSPRTAPLRQPPARPALPSSCLNFSPFPVWGTGRSQHPAPGTPAHGWEPHGQGIQGCPHQGLGEAEGHGLKQSEGLPGGGGPCWEGQWALRVWGSRRGDGRAQGAV